jgi:2-polyprenyl-3-methyl-5-hydroxy-6-metoxy-1,4-benzoquinol methylase
METETQSNINYNIKAHNKVAAIYAAIHGEIYNQPEQSRLHASLKEAMGLILCGEMKTRKRVLDLGCGAGNLTDHLVCLGAEVIASDVSPSFLTQIRQRHPESIVTTLQLNGNDLTNIEDESLDMVAIYSVLHHIPDYLRIIDECMRVLEPGGILYLDHEVPDEYWGNVATLRRFYREAKSFGPHSLMKFLRPENYIDFLIRKFRNPRYRREGDIHVFPDDHIEWGEIAARISKKGDLLLQRDYLLFRSGFNAEVYDAHRKSLSDMRLAIYRKRA